MTSPETSGTRFAPPIFFCEQVRHRGFFKQDRAGNRLADRAAGNEHPFVTHKASAAIVQRAPDFPRRRVLCHARRQPDDLAHIVQLRPERPCALAQHRGVTAPQAERDRRLRAYGQRRRGGAFGLM